MTEDLRQELLDLPKISGLAIEHVPVSSRGNWNYVRLETDKGVSGWGEATHAVTYHEASEANDRLVEDEVRKLFGAMDGQSPFTSERFRTVAWERAKRGGRTAVTAYSALEMALWDLAGRALGVRVCDLFGGALRERVPCYANINRAAHERSPDDFARQAERAAAAGFTSIKAAPFHDFPGLRADEQSIRAAIARGVGRIQAMRDAVGPDVRLMVDCHCRFDYRWAREVWAGLARVNVAWFEEPMPMETEEDRAANNGLREEVPATYAGGELRFGREGFQASLEAECFDVIMPDVKHCGGLLEFKKIAAQAETADVDISPHSPSGPVSLAASAHVSATISNLGLHEFAFGEADWRAGSVSPAERFENGEYLLPEGPGIGVWPS